VLSDMTVFNVWPTSEFESSKSDALRFWTLWECAISETDEGLLWTLQSLTFRFWCNFQSSLFKLQLLLIMSNALLFVQFTCKFYLLILHTWTNISKVNLTFNILLSSKFLERLTEKRLIQLNGLNKWLIQRSSVFRFLKTKIENWTKQQ
jgi:hypothetical protein